MNVYFNIILSTLYIKNCIMFQKSLDDIFDIILEKYGYNDELIQMKETLLHDYLSESCNNNVYKKIRHIDILVNSEGNISINKKIANK